MPAATFEPRADRSPFDVLVIGAGINGVATAAALAEAGYDVVVVDQGDLASGTSQASTMLVWGGLLYLKDWEVGTVWALCRERDRLIDEAASDVDVCEVRYVPTPGGRPRAAILAALHAYWLLGSGRRRPARALDTYAERALLAPPIGAAYAFEEGCLRASDARFVLSVAGHAERFGAEIRTYHRVESCVFDARTRTWEVPLTDTLTGATDCLTARLVVNAAGPWADTVNGAAGITAPYRHVLSRGVSLCLPRDPGHETHLVFDTDDGNALTLAPWGPVAVWASTESLHPDVETAGRIEPADVAYLLDHYNARFRRRVSSDDVVSLRVGIRPVPVTPGQRIDPRGLGLSRHHRLHVDAASPWLTIFGGKLSGCHGLAREVRALVQDRIAPTAAPRDPAPVGVPFDTASHSAPFADFPGMPAPLVAPAWSATHERCRTLEDYVRRRTTIAQWVPGGGFGRRDEHLPAMRAVALALHHGDDAAASSDLARWRDKVAAERHVLDAAAERAAAPPSGVLA